MSDKFQIRNMTDIELLDYTPYSGEPIWNTDNEALYIGDGNTVGGIRQNSIKIPTKGDWTTTYTPSVPNISDIKVGKYFKINNAVLFTAEATWYNGISTGTQTVTISYPPPGKALLNTKPTIVNIGDGIISDVTISDSGFDCIFEMRPSGIIVLSLIGIYEV